MSDSCVRQNRTLCAEPPESQNHRTDRAGPWQDETEQNVMLFNQCYLPPSHHHLLFTDLHGRRYRIKINATPSIPFFCIAFFTVLAINSRTDWTLTKSLNFARMPRQHKKRYWKVCETENKSQSQWYESSGGPRRRHNRPPGLKGKEIGLFYRDLQRNKKQEKQSSIKLTIPQSVVKRVRVLLQSIAKTSEGRRFRKEYTNSKEYSKLLKVQPQSSQLTSTYTCTDEIMKTQLDNDSKKIFKLPTTNCSKMEVDQNRRNDRTNLNFTSDDITPGTYPNHETFSTAKYNSIKSESYPFTPDFIPLKKESHAHVPIIQGSSQVDACVPSTPDLIPIKKEPCAQIPVKQECSQIDVCGPSTSDFIPIKKEPYVQVPIKQEPAHVDTCGPSTPDFHSIPIKNSSCAHVSIIKQEPSQVDSYGPSTSNFISMQKVSDAHEPVIKKEPSQVDTSGPSTSNFFSIKKESFECLPIKQEPISQSDTWPFASDFIPIQNVLSNYDSTERLFSLRGNEDKFKYDYCDIITGSFQEKLDESLTKGISIKHINSDIDNLNNIYYDHYQKMLLKDKYKNMLDFRKKLPTYKMAEELLDVIDKNQVVVISGETGCGKSTQVPQILLDDALSHHKGANFKILVTQPRRIAASSLAQRVSEERAERMGDTVGYVVRLEKVEARPRGSILFCTTGILLADLEINQGLTSYSHIILDEVHERDSHVDLAMCMLKQVMKKRKDLKLILMSATLDANRLSAYFDNCPKLHIEGLAYPVKDIYMEEILKVTRYSLPPPHRTLKNRAGSRQEMQKEIMYRADVGPWLELIKHKFDHNIYRTLLDPRIEELNIDLIVELLTYICKGDPGAILVFLPGIGDITKLLREMEKSKGFPSSRYEIHPVHSKLPSLQQNKIFERPPHGQRKIVIATNIAETSITIDDIVYVVDCAKIKVSGLNVENNIQTLQTEWVAQANLRQRRGRAGRCQQGVCYHLLTTYRAQQLPERLLPELQRSNLLEPVLVIKKLRLGKAADALNLVPDPPAPSTIDSAIKHLRLCGALDSNETLTPLGWHLARLPVHPAAGKLLVLGALFGCLNRAASVAAVWGFKDPFMLVIGKEQQVEEAKRNLTRGEPSDHVALSEAIMSWERLVHHSKYSFANEYFLSHNTLELLSEMKRQFGDNLKQMGFLPTGDIGSAWENRNSDNLSLFKAIIAASLYPNIGSVRWTGINFRNPNKIPRLVVKTPENGRVQLHPSSVMATPPGGRGRRNKLLCTPGANWLVYWLKQKSSQLYLIDVTLVYTLPLLFFGVLQFEDVEEFPNECYISFSNIKIRCDKETANLLVELRFLLDKVLTAKVGTGGDRSVQHNEFEECVLNAVIEIITAEDERTEYISDDEDLTGSDCSDTDTKKR